MALYSAVQLPLATAHNAMRQSVVPGRPLDSSFRGRVLKHQKICIVKGGRAGEFYSGPTCTLQLSPPASPARLFGIVKDGSTAHRVQIEIPDRKTSFPNKGWTDDMGLQDQRLVSQFRVLAEVSTDRAEMHRILAEQRDNWNQLFHSTIAVASISAASAAAFNGAEQALGFSAVAAILGVGVAALMALVNKFQPTQMAEEQRHAARFFKRLAKDIKATLETDPALRQQASEYWTEKVGTLQALDDAFPLSLTSVFLEKFPKFFGPSILSSPTRQKTEVRLSSGKTSINGWTRGIEADLEQTAQLLLSSDVPNYVTLATKANQINKCLAVASPLLAIGGALCAAVPGRHVSSLGASLTIGAFVIHSMSHGLQMGAVYETYRNCAGYYSEIETSIRKALQLPVQEREDARLFRQKVSLLLGRRPCSSHIVESDDKKAGALF